ncbi:MAG: hypothetical protein EA380_09130 [Phycisphaeraceae bacterium]|nr:MAG: hypothetical protein EA380_09130 [Phycisphaeraceae bacterium]
MRFAASAALLAALSGVASGSITSFVETFDSDAANWRNSDGSAVLDWFPAGGPDGSAYASGTFNLINATGGFPPIVIRGQVGFGSSGGAFAGDWIAAGVTGFSFDFRHDLPESIIVTGRFATPANFPGASTESSILVAPNTWTTVFYDLTEGSSDIISLGGGTYPGIFSNIGNIQIGFNVPSSLSGQDLVGRFDIDNISIIPAPGAAGVLALGLCGLTGRRRRR